MDRKTGELLAAHASALHQAQQIDKEEEDLLTRMNAGFTGDGNDVAVRVRAASRIAA